jgi:hypothetical protein
MAIVADVRALTDRLEQSHEERFQEIAARRQAISQKLSRFQRERTQEQTELRAALHTEVVARSRSVADQLAGFDRELAATAKKQNAQLKADAAENRAQVSRLLDGFHVDRVETAGIWGNYYAFRAATQDGPKPSVQHHSTALQDKVFTFLAGHPNGVKIHDIERHFHASRAGVGHAIDGLIEQNRARKDDVREIYFAT